MENNKIKKIENVILDYSFYPGEDYYSDGDIESFLLETCRSENEEKVLKNSDKWEVLYHLSDIRENIIDWIKFDKNSDVLEIGSGCGAITGSLSKKCGSVTCVELSEKRSLINAYRNKSQNNIIIKLGNFQEIEPSLGLFEYITLIGVLEYANLYVQAENPYIELLKIAKKHLKKNGKLIIAIENKIGLKYINGAPEDHVGQPYVGINDYISDDKVRTFSQPELDNLLKVSGYVRRKFYYPVPDYKLPLSIYSSELMPVPGEIRTYKTNFSNARMYSFYEDVMNDQLAYDKMFGYMANSFIVVSGNEPEEEIIFAKYNRERKSKFRIATYIKKMGDNYVVEKHALNSEAVRHIDNLKKNEDSWSILNKNLKKITGKLEHGVYITDYIKGRTLNEIMYDYRHSISAFIGMITKLLRKYYDISDELYEQFYKTPEFVNIFGDVEVGKVKCCRITNIDLIFSNIIIDHNNEAYALDYEWIFDFPIPYRYVLWRAVTDIFLKYLVYFKEKITLNEYYKQLQFSDDEVSLYKTMECNFTQYVFGEKNCEIYTTNYIKPSITSHFEMR